MNSKGNIESVNFSKYLRVFTLVLSLFAFSGFSTARPLQQLPNTEIGISLKVKTRCIVSFIKSQHKNVVSPGSGNTTYSIFSLTRFNQIVKVKYQLSSQLIDIIRGSTVISKAVYTPRKAGYRA